MLALAEDPATPLLERAKFLAIFASNLDEFYMVRVAGLKRRLQTGLPVRGADRLPLRDAARADRRADRRPGRPARRLLRRRGPAGAGRRGHRARALGATWTPPSASGCAAYFREQVFPVLTPLAVDPAHPFPYISGLSLNLAVVVRDPDGGPELFARVKVPNNVPRFVTGRRTTSRASGFLPVEELIAAHLGQLFSGMQVVEHHLFRVTRNAEVEVDEDRDEDLLQALERELARRRFGPPVRLEVAASISDHVLDLLVRELDMDSHDVLRVPGLLDLSALWQVYDEVDRPDLKDRPFVPATHPRCAEGETPRSVFARLRDGDILVHHPYHSFSTSVQRFIEQAAADPNVLAIKQTLYRTSGDSPIVDALIDAAEAGKQVVVLVEVKARFDEQANIGWARTLERAGCHVVYGLVGPQDALQDRAGGTPGGQPDPPLLPHRHRQLPPEDRPAVRGLRPAHRRPRGRRRPDRPVQRAHRLQPADRVPAAAGRAARRPQRHHRADRARDRPRPGRRRRAWCRSRPTRWSTRRSSTRSTGRRQAGVQVDLVIRGMCTLRPGVPGLSENIRVRSILGRFLEHSRVFRFGNDGDDAEFWIGSADLMHRNLDRRVEALVRVTDPARARRARPGADAVDERRERARSSWPATAPGPRRDRRRRTQPLLHLAGSAAAPSASSATGRLG